MEKVLRDTLPGGIFKGVPPARSLNMQRIGGKANKTTELRLRMALIRAGLKGWVVRPDDYFGNPDFIFKKQRIAIFVDGCFWHGCRNCLHIPKTNRRYWETKIIQNIKRDRKNTRLLRKNGFSVIRIWEHELKNKLAASINKIRFELNI